MVAKLDPEFVRTHRLELSYLTGRFLAEHLIRVHACNAMSVSAATGIPRETVRRKVRWLVRKGWVAVGTRGQLTLVPGMSSSFEAFDLETIARFHAASRDILRRIDQRTSAPRTTRGGHSR